MDTHIFYKKEEKKKGVKYVSDTKGEQMEERNTSNN